MTRYAVIDADTCQTVGAKYRTTSQAIALLRLSLYLEGHPERDAKIIDDYGNPIPASEIRPK